MILKNKKTTNEKKLQRQKRPSKHQKFGLLTKEIDTEFFYPPHIIRWQNQTAISQKKKKKELLKTKKKIVSEKVTKKAKIQKGTKILSLSMYYITGQYGLPWNKD